MTLVESYRAFARYNTWMNRRLFALAGELTAEERQRDMGAFFRSIHGTLNHILLADRVWMARFTGDRERFASRDARGDPIVIRALDHIVYTDFTVLGVERTRTDADIEEWTDSLTTEQVGSNLRYKTTRGEPHEHPLWQAVSHFFNHQTHHRGQVTTLLTQLGRDPGVTDLAVFLREGH